MDNIKLESVSHSPSGSWYPISRWINKRRGLRAAPFLFGTNYLGRGKELIRVMNYSVVLPVLTGAAESEKGWRLSRNPKRAGEISEAAFGVRAHSLGFLVAKPWGDSEKYDFVLDAGSKLWRVQLKSTEVVHARGHEIQPIYSVYGRERRDIRRMRLMRWWCTFSRVMCGM